MCSGILDMVRRASQRSYNRASYLSRAGFGFEGVTHACQALMRFGRPPKVRIIRPLPFEGCWKAWRPSIARPIFGISKRVRESIMWCERLPEVGGPQF